MAFELKIYDRKGTELHLGDTVMVSDGNKIHFYAEVKWIAKQSILTPFHTFSFHSFEKVNAVPIDAVKSSEQRYNIWYLAEGKEDEVRFEDYLKSWRECEIAMEKGCFRIRPLQNKIQQTLDF